MDRTRRFATETITIDNSMRTPRDGSATVLLYDGVNDCYYKTTIKHIIMVALSEIREVEKNMADRMNEFESRIETKQNEFIADMVKTNESIIKLVRTNS